MDYILEGFKEAISLLINLDKNIVDIVSLSFVVSLSATFIASIFSVPLGIYFGIKKFLGKELFSRITYTMMSIPTVVVGLVVAILLSRRGPIGYLNLLYTKEAMIIAQSFLVFPMIFGLTYGLVNNRKKKIQDTGLTLGANTFQIVVLMIRELKVDIMVNVATGFSRAISEVGAVMVVGGNIKGHTRVITTTISMMNSMGDYPMAIALGLVLLIMSFIIHSIVYSYSKER